MFFRNLFFLVTLLFITAQVNGQGAIFQILEKGDSVALSQLFEQNPSIDLTETSQGFQPLHYAARDNSVGCVRLLLEKGAPVNGKGATSEEGDWTPLMLAIHNGNFEIAKMLLDSGAVWNWENDKNFSAITIADKRNDYWINFLRKDKEAAWIQWCVQKSFDNNNLEEIQELIGAYGFEKVAAGSYGWPLICFAARDNKLAILSFLVKRQGQANQKTPQGWTPLMLAVINNHTEVCNVLVRNGADLSIKDSSGKTAITWAQEVKLPHLLEIFADPDKGMATYERNLKLFKAIERNSLSGVRFALEDGADIEAVGSSNRTPLATALYKNNAAIASYLISKGADPNREYGHYENRTHLLFDAARLGNNEFIITLARNGVKFDRTNDKGLSPQGIALENKFWWTAKIIADTSVYYAWKAYNSISKKWQPDPALQKVLQGDEKLLNYQDEKGNTLLNNAVLNKATEWLEYLLAEGADGSIENKSFQSAEEIVEDEMIDLYELYFSDFDKAARYNQFFKAIEKKQANKIPALLKGLDINFKNADGLTALHLAINTSQDSLVQYFLKAGANPNRKTNEGRSPAYLAAINHDYATILSLESAGAKIDSSDLEKGVSYWIRNHLSNPAETKKKFLLHRELCKAIERGDSAAVAKYLHLGADPNVHGQRGMNALHLAVEKGHLPIVKLLLDKGANRTLEALTTLQTPKMLAALNKHYNVVDYLGFDTVDVFQKDWKGVTLYDMSLTDPEVSNIRSRQLRDAFLFMLADDGDINEFKTHEQTIGDINVLDRSKETFLIKAARSGSLESVQWLLKKGADPSIAPDPSGSALALAAAEGDFRMSKLLLTYKHPEKFKEAAIKEAKKNSYSVLSKWLAGDTKAALNLELLQATIDNDSTRVMKALLASADPNVREHDGDGFAPIHYASRGGRLGILSMLLKNGADPQLAAKAGDQFYTPLMLAAHNDLFQCADILLQHGADINWKNDAGLSAKDIALNRSAYITKLFTDKEKARKEYRERKLIFDLIAKNNIPALQNAINENLPLDQPDAENYLPLHRAVKKGSLEMTKLLLQKNADINSAFGGYTPLAIAVMNEDINMTSFLVENKADVNVKLANDSTVLQIAEARNLEDFVTVLNGNTATIRDYEEWKQAINSGDTATFFAKLRKGLDVKYRMKDGYSMLHYAAREGETEMVKALIGASVDVDFLTNDRWSPLMLAANNGHWKTVYLLLNNGADKNLQNADFNDAGDLAMIKGHKLVKDLISEPDSIYNQLMLIDQVTRKHTQEVEALLRKNLNVNFVSYDNWNALHYAVRADLREIAAMLLRRGADISSTAITTDGPYTPLMLAVTNDLPEMTKLLLDFGADPNIKLGNYTAHTIAKKDSSYWCEQILKDPEAGYKRFQLNKQLRKAILADDLAEIQEAIFNGASRDENLEDGLSPLHFAVRENKTASIGYFLRNQPNLQKETSWGSTPLMVATWNRLYRVAAELIRHGADPYYRNKEGVGALEFAKEKGYAEFENLLRSPQQFLLQQDLLDAVRNKDLTTVTALIRKGVDPNAPLCLERPLVIATASRQAEMVEFLLNAKADPELRDEMQQKPILIITGFDSLQQHWTEFDLSPFKIFHQLFDHGAKITDVDSLNGSLADHLRTHPIGWYAERSASPQAYNKVLETEKLFNYIKSENQTAVSAQLKAGKKGMVDAFGNSLLNYSIYHQSDSMSKLLLTAGEKQGLFPGATLQLVLDKGSSDLFKLLKQKGFSLDQILRSGETVLTAALMADNTKVVKTLLDLGVNPNLRSASGETPLYIAARGYYPSQSVLDLLKAGADPNVPSTFKAEYPIHVAVDSTNISALIQYGADVNASNKFGQTALHSSMTLSSQGVSTLLIKKGANVNATDLYDGTTPLMVAVENDNIKGAVQLINAGADVYVKTSAGESAYSIAQKRKNKRMLNLLINPSVNQHYPQLVDAINANDTTLALKYIRLGVDINQEDQSGYTPLHTLVETLSRENIPMIFFLIGHGARYDLEAITDRTAFDEAIHRKAARRYDDSLFLAVIEKMLNKGYDINRQNKDRSTALELAVKLNDLKVAKMLLDAGAKRDIKNVAGETVYDLARANGNSRMIQLLDGKFDPYSALTFAELYKDFHARPVNKKGSVADLLQAEQTMDALRLERKPGSADYMYVLNDYVFILAFNNRLSEALVAAEEYTMLATEAGEKGYDLREMYRVQEVLYRNSGNTKKAIESTKKALQLITVDGEEKMNAYRMLAALYKDSVSTHYYLLALDQLKNGYYDTVNAYELRAEYANHLVEQKDTSGITMLRQIEKMIRDTVTQNTLARDVLSGIIEHELKAGNKKAAIEYYNKLRSRKDRLDYPYVLAKLALKLGEEKDAELFLRETKKTSLNALSADYMLLQHLLKNNDTVRLVTTLREYNLNFVSQLKKEFRFLSEEEKYNLLTDKQQYFDIIHTAAARYPENAEIVSMSLNSALFQKGALMRSSSALRNVIDTTNQTVKGLYARWKQVKLELEGQYTLESSKRTLDIPFLEEKLRQYEKALFSYSQVSDSVATWNSVQEKMAEGDVAVEFISYQVFADEWKDSTQLMAIVLSKNGDPFLIPLCSETALLNELKKPAEEKDLTYVNRIYMRGNESHRVEVNTSANLYQMVFQPLEKKVSDARRLYLSLSGSVHKISLAALPVGKDSLFIDKYNFHYVSSIASLPGKEQERSNKTISLFGGINYEKGISTSIAPEGEGLLDRSIDLGRNNNGGWKYLPGTKIEAEMVYKMGKKFGWKAAIDSGALATEARVKSLNGNAPSIIHIATHGYFFPEPGKGKIQENEPASAFITGENPLFRTGLMLAGANTTWKKGYTESGKEDGILTGYEVSNLDLKKAELVVLSACETGLGDIKGSEGVYGLQRAFKIAGAKKLIMSLWQVPDKETAELMEVFYSNLFSGMDYDAAFKKAQKAMREKYEPYFWAAFVMVE